MRTPTAFDRAFAVASLAAVALGASGCIVVTTASIRSSNNVMLHLDGSVVGPNGAWSGTGLVCYSLHFYFGLNDKKGCAPFSTDGPGHFAIDKDITAEVHDMYDYTVANATTYIEIPGHVDGNILSTSNEQSTLTIGSGTQSITRITSAAEYKIPAGMLAAPAGPPPVALNAPGNDDFQSFTRSLQRSSDVELLSDHDRGVAASARD
jgi:hypothetical protein